MKKLSKLLAAIALATASAAFAQTTTTLTPSEDAYVRGGSAADNNYGTNVLLGVRTANTGLNTYWSYIKFNNSGVSGQVISAKLRMFTALSSSGSVQTNVYATTATWNETTITWNNKPALGTQLGVLTVNNTSYVWFEVDVTSYVQTQQGQPAVAFALANPAVSNQLVAVQSRESSNPSQLVIVTNGAPTAGITAPADGTVFSAPANVTVSANATDADGAVTQVQFFANGTLIGTDTSAPYSIDWTNVAAGTYSLTAVATDNIGATTTSSAVSIVVNAAPSITITNPTNNATFTAPANITLTATASDSDGTISKVEFFYGGTNLIATLTAPPYSVQWTGVPQGAYVLTAVATDNLNSITTSTPVNVTVGPAVAQLYFTHVDHVNTPRLAADATGTTVWRWDQQEPFGVNVPDENPSGLGAFDLPLRLPGQYYDKETNRHYNYFRVYDPSIGRYVESDLIGLRGGLNTYGYVEANPLASADPTGLITCIFDPVNFNTIGCTRVGLKEEDRDLTSWRQDPPIILSTWTIPLPRIGFGAALPNRNLAPVVPNAGRTEDYGEIQFGFFDVKRMYRQNFLVTEEEWECENNCSSPKRQKRVISCLGSWTPTDLVQRGGLGFRQYQKRLN